jgi:hypothetical protein
MAAVDLCTLSDVRQALEMPTSDTTRDALIGSLITIYSQAIMNEVNREFAPITGSVGTPTTRRFKLELGSFRLDLDPYDLQTVSSVVVAPEGSSPQTLTDVTEFQAQPVTKADGTYTSIEFSHLLTSIFTSTTAVRFGYCLVDVSGVWGFPSIPAPVKDACILSVTSAMRRDISAFALGEVDALQIATERQASYGLPTAARRMLNSYRRHIIF